jgi:hypothetical protein
VDKQNLILGVLNTLRKLKLEKDVGTSLPSIFKLLRTVKEYAERNNEHKASNHS